MKEAFRTVHFRNKTKGLIAKANEIIEELQAQGYTLTLRQLYYQLVARDIIKNNFRNYKSLGETMNLARLGGYTDWNAIEDRTRNLKGNAHWDSPEDIIKSSASQYLIDRWNRQPSRIEVWVEKDALVDVVRRACIPNDVNYFSCRGYTSQTAVYWAAKRLQRYLAEGQEPIIIHLGDHDPSGVDMTRDISNRYEIFTGQELAIERIALNLNQVEQYDPPPNFAKESDSRYEGYRRQYGEDCWELDALDPRVIHELIETAINQNRDAKLWEEDTEQQEKEKGQLQKIADRYDEVVKFVNKPKKVKKPRKPRKKK